MTSNGFGNRLREALEGAGFSKLQFVRQLQARGALRKARGEPVLRKVDRSALYSFLKGRDFPPVDTLGEMADVLGVRLGWLAEGEEPVERDLPRPALPIYLVDGRRGPWRRASVAKRLEARKVFEEAFLRPCEGFSEAEPLVRLVFQDLLERRLARRRNRGDRSPADPAYRASTARGLYLKCFLDVMHDLPPGTEFSSPEFTTAFSSRVGAWLEDERG